MTRRSTDVFATTNPALCALMLWSYCKAYEEQDPRGCEHPLLFIPVPFALSGKVRDTLAGTNNATGFLNWVQRNPQLALDYPRLLNNTAAMTRAGLVFALARDLLTVDDTGHFHPSSTFRPSAKRLKQLGPTVAEATQASARFGTWLGQLERPHTIFHALGVTT